MRISAALAPRILIQYPIVMQGFSEGPRIPFLMMPKDITREEADRVKRLVDAIVIQKAAEPGEDASSAKGTGS